MHLIASQILETELLLFEVDEGLASDGSKHGLDCQGVAVVHELLVLFGYEEGLRVELLVDGLELFVEIILVGEVGTPFDMVVELACFDFIMVSWSVCVRPQQLGFLRLAILVVLGLLPP